MNNRSNCYTGNCTRLVLAACLQVNASSMPACFISASSMLTCCLHFLIVLVSGVKHYVVNEIVHVSTVMLA